MGEVKLIADLDINDYQKHVLALLSKPRTTYEIAAKLKKSYSSVNQTLGILTALGFVKKIRKMSGGVIYKLNEKIEL